MSGLITAFGTGASTAPSITASNSMVFGDSNTITGAGGSTNLFAFGSNFATNAAQIQNNTLLVGDGASLGINTGVTRDSFFLGSGFSNTAPTSSYRSLWLGNGLSSLAGTISNGLIVGDSHSLSSGTRDNLVVLGYSHTLGTSADRIFLSGASISATGTNPRDRFAQGNGHTITGDFCFVQGTDLTASANSCFAQGYGYLSSGATGYASFSQGAAVTVAGDYSFGQGGWYVDTVARCSFAQGQGVDLTGWSVASTSIMAQGENITFTGSAGSTSVNGAFIQGDTITMGFTGGGFHGPFLVQGYNMPSLGARLYQSVFVQGRTHNGSGASADVNRTFIQGSNIFFGVGGGGHVQLFAQGLSHSIGGGANDSLVQGQGHTITGSRVFAQGAWCHVTRDDQKTWGSNRAVLGAAQSSKIVKHLQTTNATQTTLITLDLEEDKVYNITAKVVVKNTTTASEAAVWNLLVCMAYRNTGGGAVIQGGNIDFNTAAASVVARSNTGGDAANWEVDLDVSTNDLLLRVTGDATDTLEWCADLEFVEVAG